MLSFLGQRYRHCDGISRRRFLSAGVLTIGGLTLADLLRAEAVQGVKSSEKAVINLHLDGGPPQMDMIDLKPGTRRKYAASSPASTRYFLDYKSPNCSRNSPALPTGSHSCDRLLDQPASTTHFNVNRVGTRRVWRQSVVGPRWVALSPSCADLPWIRLHHSWT